MTAFAWMREKLAALPRRAPEPADPPGVTVPASLVRSAKLAAWMAYIALVYFLLLYTFDIARDRAGTMHFTHVGFWIGDVQVYAPYLFGFFVVAVGIPYVAKISIPTFMSLDWRMNFWPKMWALFIATAVSLVVVAGTFTVQGDTLLERDRESAVAVAQVEQSGAVLQARIAAKEAELRSMMENRNAYLAQAASVGAAEWQRSYIEQTPSSDPQRDRIVRALGAARAADAVREELGQLRTQAATQTVSAAVAGRVTTENTSWIASTLGWLEGARAILLSLVMDIVCLIMPWIALRLEQARNRQIDMAGPREFDAAHAIEDMRAEPSVVPQPMESAKEVVKDGETGEVYEKIKPKEYWRKKKGKPQTVRIDGERLPDERGVQYENDTRVAMAAAGVVMAPSVEEQTNRDEGQVAQEVADERVPDDVQEEPHHEADSTPLTLDEETLNAIAALNADPAEDPDPAHTLPNNEGVLVADDEAPAPRRELVEEDA